MKKVFLLIFFAQLINFFIIPPFQIPDEVGHYENVYWVARAKYPYEILAKGTKNPLYTDEIYQYFPNRFSFKKISKNNPLILKKRTEFEKKISKDFYPINFQAYHPFLYYLLLSPSMFLADLLDLSILGRFYLTRFFSSVLFWGLIFFVYQTLKIIKNKEKDIKTFMIFYGLNPLVLYYSVGINPDLGVAVFSTIVLYLSFIFLNKKSIKFFIILGIMSGLTYLNKTSGLITFLFVGLVIFFKKEILLFKMKKFFTYSSSFFLTALPWFYLHLYRYGTMATPSFRIAHDRPTESHNLITALILAVLEFRHSIMHYAGFFGSQNQYWPNKLYFISYTLLIFFLFFIGFIKNGKKYFILTLYLLSGFLFFYLLAFYYKQNGYLWDLQGRHILMIFFPFYFFVYLGLKNIFQKIDIFLKFLILVNFLIILFFLYLPTFYGNKNVFYALNTLFPGFGYGFIASLLCFLVLNFLNFDIIFFHEKKSKKTKSLDRKVN